MARMDPEDIEGLEGPTEGERKVFRFLREAARPDQDFIGWLKRNRPPAVPPCRKGRRIWHLKLFDHLI
jgi:hypothetical protein